MARNPEYAVVNRPGSHPIGPGQISKLYKSKTQHMKKTMITVSLVAVMILNVQAQTARFGFTAGAAFSNYHVKMDGSTETADSKAGFTAGAIADIPMGKNFSIQPGLHLIQKGTKDKQTYGGATAKTALTINLVELPVNFLFNTNSTSGNFFIGAGPSIGFALSGKWKYEYDGDKNTESVNFGSGDEDDMKSLDIGANALAGYCFPNGLMLVVNYNAGLNNLAPGGSADGTLKSHYFGIRFGWMLNNSKTTR